MLKFEIINHQIIVTDDIGRLFNINHSATWIAHEWNNETPSVDALLDYRSSLEKKLAIEKDDQTKTWYRREICAVDYLIYISVNKDESVGI